MKKIFLFVIAALGALTIASCEKEIDNTTPVDGAEVVVTISADIDGVSAGEDKAMMHNPSGFKFQTGDVVTFTDAKGNTTTCTLTEAAKTATFTAVIPGLATGDVTGRFSVNYDGEIENDQTPSSAAYYAPLALQSKEITLKQGTQSVEVSVGFAGAFLRFWPVDPNATEADERIVAVSLGDYSSTCTASDAYKGLIYTTATNFQGLQIPATTCKPEYVLTTSKGTYTFTSIKQTEFKEGYLYDIPLNLTKASKSVKELTLTEGMFSTNAPMIYRTELQGCNEYGFGGSPDWILPLDEGHATNRQTKYGTVANMWDNDATTCYHTNVDWRYTPYTSWGESDHTLGVGGHYMQFNLGDAYSGVKVSLTSPTDSYFKTGYILQTSEDGSSFEEAESVSCAGSGAVGTSTEVTGTIKAIRILPNGTGEDATTANNLFAYSNAYSTIVWKQMGPSFGIAELTIKVK